jgi:hypothetical protein
MSESIHPLRIRANPKPQYPAAYLDSKAFEGRIWVDGVDVRELIAENARLKDEIALLLHVGKEVEE